MAFENGIRVNVCTYKMHAEAVLLPQRLHSVILAAVKNVFSAI